MVWKQSTNTTSEGTAAKFGAANINKISALFSGDADVDTVTINSPFIVQNGKLQVATITNTGVLTLPTSTDTLVGRATTDTLTNKTITSPTITGAAISTSTLTLPIISQISNTGTLTLPTSTDTLVGRATTDTLTNKTLTTPTITNPTLSGASGALTLPAGPDTLLGAGTISTGITAAKTFNDQTLKRRNPAGTFTLTEVHPAITADRDRRSYQSYNMMVRQEGSTYYVIEGLTHSVVTSSTSAITALQAANDALTAGRTWKEKILFVGDYSSVSVSLLLDSNTILEVVGRLKLATAANLPVVKNRNGTATEGSQDHDIELIGGEYDGNKANQSGGNLINFFTANRITVTGVRAHDSKTDGLTFNGCDDVLVQGCRFYDNTQMGVRWTSNTTYGVHANNVRMIGNYASGNSINGLWIGGTSVTWECYGGDIVGNTCYNNTVGGIYVDWHSYGIQITGNDCQSNGNSIGSGGGGGIVFNGQANGTPYYGNGYINITGNSCYNNDESGIFGVYAKNVRVSGNQCTFNKWHGISIQACKQCQIEGNSCVNNSQLTTNTYAGIRFYDATGSDANNYPAIDNIICNNTCNDDQGTKTQKYGIEQQGIGYRNTIRNNHLKGNATAGAIIGDISNCYDNDGFRVKHGYWSGNDPVLGAEGALQGMISTYATTGTITKVVDTTGTKIRFATAASTSDFIGAKVAPFTEVAQNPVFKCKFKLTQADTNTALCIGFNSNSAVDPTDTANVLLNLDGIMFFNSAGTWFNRSNNGNSSTTSRDSATAYNTSSHELTIQCDNTGPRWYVILDDVILTNGLVTTDLPTAGTDLGLYWWIKTATSAAKSFDIWDVEVAYLD